MSVGPGFRVSRRADGATDIYIKAWTPELEIELAGNSVVHVWQDGPWAGHATVLPRLVAHAPRIWELVTSTAPVDDWNAINEFSNLQSLTLQQPAPGVRYERLLSLRELKLWEKATIQGIDGAQTLQSLHLWSLKLEDLTPISGLAGLRSLRLTQMGRLRRLDGIEQLPLEELIITYGNRLSSVEPLGKLRSLRSLSIDGNSKATDAGAIASLSNLEKVTLDNGPALPDLEGMGSLPALRVLRVMNTPIGSGPCSVAPLARLQQLRQLSLLGRPRSLKNLIDFESIGDIASLEVLMLDMIADLSSIGWMRRLQRLTVLAMGGTSVLDRDLSPLLDLPHLTTLDLTMRGYSSRGTLYRPSAAELTAPVKARRAALDAARRHGASE